MKIYLLLPMVICAAALGANPGNIFVKGQDVKLSVPETWTAWQQVDVDGKELGKGVASGGIVNLGELPIGFYELRRTGGPEKITLGVVPPIHPAENTPIALDAAMSWFYAADEGKVRDACRLCRLAGVNWVRDRASWPEIETARGVWAGDTRYERTMRIEHEEGLKILQVNHISPPWAQKDPRHFPEDLRDVYAFYKGLAARWRVLADAIEPWNEPDIVEFGGHTGCEIASFQKAAYLGMKAGDPKRLVNEAVFAIDRPETLDDFGDNEAYPYFDRYDLHHYKALQQYPILYARQRAQSGGRPMWTTEFNLTVHWSDEKTKEPSDEDLHIQAYRVAKVFATALNEGTQKAFYFIFGNYVERHVQYGLVHDDLTPRPAYVAFAAVGRLLNGAQRLGRVDLGNEKLKAFVFKTEVDGSDKETVVAWSETKPSKVEISGTEKEYDYLGRELASNGEVELTRAPVFFVLPDGGSKTLKIEKPPALAEWKPGAACPVVLQIIGAGDVNQSAFILDPSKQLRLVAYNFGEKPAKGTLTVEGATGGAGKIEIPAGGREERILKIDGPGKVIVHGNMGDVGNAIVSARVEVAK